MSGPVNKSLRLSRKLGFELLGTLPCEGSPPGAIFRLQQNPTTSPRFRYLIVTDRTDLAPTADLLSLDNFRDAKAQLKKRSRNGLGIEFLVSEARNRSGTGVAKWFADLRDARRFCQSSGCQFVLSSGARDTSEMVSADCLEEILGEIGIDSRQYWQELERWLENVLSRKVIAE